MIEETKKTKNGILPSFLFILSFLCVVFILAWSSSIQAQNHLIDSSRDKKAGEEKQTESEMATKFEQKDVNKELRYIVTEELMCNGTRVQAITSCADLWDCSQTMYFDRGGHKRLVKDIIGYRAYDWGCVKNKNKGFIAVGYGTGGNCVFCEWNEIYDVEGNIVMNNYFDPYFSGGGISSGWGYCAETYINYSSGFRHDENLLREACQTLNKSEFEEMKAKLKQWKAASNQMDGIIDKQGNYLTTMAYVALIRQEYDHKKRSKPGDFSHCK